MKHITIPKYSFWEWFDHEVQWTVTIGLKIDQKQLKKGIIAFLKSSRICWISWNLGVCTAKFITYEFSWAPHFPKELKELVDYFFQNFHLLVHELTFYLRIFFLVNHYEGIFLQIGSSNIFLICVTNILSLSDSKGTNYKFVFTKYFILLI